MQRARGLITAVVVVLATSVVPTSSVEAQSLPSRPSSVSVERADGSLTASWPASAGATGYHITYSSDSENNWSLAAHNHPSTSITIDRADNTKTYTVGVRAGNASGWSQWRNSPATGPYTPPPPPVPSRPSSVSVERADGSLTASWPAADGATGYHITYSSDGENNWSLAAYNHPSTSITIDRADNTKTYVVGVRAGNTSGWSPWRNSPAASPYTPPPPPVPPRPSSVSVERADGSLTVSWPAAAGATGYHITYSSDSENSWSLAAHNHLSTSITIDGADNSKTYVVGVRAGNASGWSEWRNSPAASPLPAPTAPSGLAATAGNARVTLSWDDPSDSSITGYSVRYRPTGETWVSHSFSGLATSTTITGLTNDIQYEAQVSATNAVGTGEWSPSAKATPQIPLWPCPPGTPSAPTIRPAGLHWTVMFDSPPLWCGVSHSSIELRYKAADVSTWTKMTLPADAVEATINSGLSLGVYYEIQIRATSRIGFGPWSPIATATATAYSLAETGVQDYSQTWTVYLCGGGPARHADFDTAEEYADFLNEELTPRLSEITAGEYEPTFIAATGEMPTGTHTGGYSLFYDCKAESGQHIVFGHHGNTGYAGLAVLCAPEGWRYVFVNENTVSAVYPREVIEKNIWHTAGHEIGHILGWSHSRISADPYEFMNTIYNAPYDQGDRYTWCGS